MKKRIITIAILFLILFVILPVYNRLTGNAVSVSTANSCVDTEQDTAFHIQGKIHGTYNTLTSEIRSFENEDSCVDNKTLIEYYCSETISKFDSAKSSIIHICDDACVNGACTTEDVPSSTLYTLPGKTREKSLLTRIIEKFKF